MIFKLALVCAATVIVNHTDVWDEQDKVVLKQASKRCGQIFPDAPCLKKLVKLEDNSYQIYCGASDESKD